jgi:uncharacterized repeat protein (TIGR01451 family)
LKTNTKVKFISSIIALIGLGAMGVMTAAPVQALPNQLDGTVYWDQNGNGVQDVGEPGLGGLIVRFGGNSAPSTTTDANGDYILTGVSGTATLEVFTGWFRSQCNSLNCAAGPGTDNDFTVNNQFIQLSTSGTTGGTFDVGLVPDWGGAYPVTSTNVSRPVDIAARATYLQGCNAGTAAQRLCNPGDTISLRSTFMNQGTEPITNPVFSLQVPLGHTITDIWTTNNQSNPDANSITVLQPFNASLGYGIYQLNGTLAAGASSGMFTTISVTADAIGSALPYATVDPRDKQVVLQVIGVDQSGDPDSTFCLSEAQDYIYGNCALPVLGDHDKTVSADHTDGATWNVSGTSVARVDSVEIAAASTGTPVDVCQESRTVAATLNVTNTSTGDSPIRNIEIALDVPTGLSFNLADNPGWFTGGDGRPHTFINLAILPEGAQDVPVNLSVNSGITSADNGTAALQLGAEIVEYTTGQVTVQPAGNSTFNAGSMDGTLLAFDDIAVTSEACPTDAGNGDNQDEDGQLASTGINMVLLIGVATSVILVSAIAMYRLYGAGLKANHDI